MIFWWYRILLLSWYHLNMSIQNSIPYTSRPQGGTTYCTKLWPIICMTALKQGLVDFQYLLRNVQEGQASSTYVFLCSTTPIWISYVVFMFIIIFCTLTLSLLCNHSKISAILYNGMFMLLFLLLEVSVFSFI